MLRRRRRAAACHPAEHPPHERAGCSREAPVFDFDLGFPFGRASLAMVAAIRCFGVRPVHLVLLVSSLASLISILNLDV
uniref:Uncharacterized protein n=1 Tax=Setaria viridis TaxID=4556 RepID=A0A4U6SZ90_SETVI|nr:hypothetical protein SEVIR_9G301301v2 [Setaria viridis]